jgi:hypothetical protein
MAKKKKEDWVTRLKRKAHELLKGDQAYAPKKAKKPKVKKVKKKKDLKTARTSHIESRLRKSGMSEADIKKLRGKK